MQTAMCVYDLKYPPGIILGLSLQIKNAIKLDVRAFNSYQAFNILIKLYFEISAMYSVSICQLVKI